MQPLPSRCQANPPARPHQCRSPAFLHLVFFIETVNESKNSPQYLGSSHPFQNIHWESIDHLKPVAGFHSQEHRKHHQTKIRIDPRSTKNPQVFPSLPHPLVIPPVVPGLSSTCCADASAQVAPLCNASVAMVVR